MTNQLANKIYNSLDYLTSAEFREMQVMAAIVEADNKRWKPTAGPQLDAYNSLADELFFGGAAGGGKTDLILGLAHTKHQHSIIFRREYPQLKGIKERSDEIFKSLGKFNSNDYAWRLKDGRIIEFGAVQYETSKEKYQGRARDFNGYDEITHFTESQYIFLNAWTRSSIPGQRCRVVCTGNPPVTAEGDWVIRYWAPWLDKQHPHPAKPGELRWYTTLDGKQTECVNGEPFTYNGEIITPRSRTFIPAKIDDNPYLRGSGYKSLLQGLPEELREKMLDGDFASAREDARYQLIPTRWVELAQERWRNRQKPTDLQMSALGVDVARGGKDKTILSPLYGNYFDKQQAYLGRETPDGISAANLILPIVDKDTRINIDIIGVGSAVYDACRALGLKNVVAINASESADGETNKSGLFGFVNMRALLHWQFREALDPETGDELALPDDRELLADLTAPHYVWGPRGVKVESKDEIRERIGRSPDKGDSIIYAHAKSGNQWIMGSF